MPDALLTGVTHTKRLKKEKQLSRLESLPIELIEMIFFYAPNLNLPRASSTLAAALSSEHTYRTLIIFAFGYFAFEYCDREIDPSVARLQSAIVGCRWFTSQRIRACLPELLRLALRRNWFWMVTSTKQVPNLDLSLALALHPGWRKKQE
jgi:hypothetical protein